MVEIDFQLAGSKKDQLDVVENLPDVVQGLLGNNFKRKKSDYPLVVVKCGRKYRDDQWLVFTVPW